MNIYLLSQGENTGYDTFDACIVAAETEDAARLILPGWAEFGKRFTSWASSPEKVSVKLIGTAIEGTEEGEILSSFNAG